VSGSLMVTRNLSCIWSVICNAMRNELEIELDSFFSMTPPQVCMLCDCCFDNIE
jgi:hypothetical protein